ncbi:hypothetical protein GCM10027436_32160 [Actinophytocola sediminis]
MSDPPEHALRAERSRRQAYRFTMRCPLPVGDDILHVTAQLCAAMHENRNIRILSGFWRGQRDTHTVQPAVNPGPTMPDDHYRPVS